VQNLKQRHPGVSQERIERALELHDGHAGATSQYLRMKQKQEEGGAPRVEEFDPLLGHVGKAESKRSSPSADHFAKVNNLAEQFPHKSREEISRALERCGGHAGQVRGLFNTECR